MELPTNPPQSFTMIQALRAQCKGILSRLQGMLVNSEKECKVVWMDSRKDNFFMKSLYTVLESGASIPFLMDVI